MMKNLINWTEQHAISPVNSNETYQASGTDFPVESRRTNFNPGKNHFI